MHKPTMPPPDIAPDAVAGSETLPVLPPLAALVEIVVLLVLPAAADYFLPSFPSLTEMQPHFFWLPVLLLSLQYGTVSGLLGAGVAIALAFGLGIPEQEIGENHFSYLLRIWTQPVLWLVTALVLGQFRMRQIEKKQQLARAVSELSIQRAAIADYATNLRRRCEMLERELATRRMPPASSLLAELDRLDLPPQQATTALREALAIAFGAATISLYGRDGEGLRRLDRFAGSATQTAAPETFPADHPLSEAILRRAMRLSALDAQDEALLHGVGLVAVPIPHAAPGQSAAGMLLIEHLPAREFDDRTAARLAAIARHLTDLAGPGASTPRPAASDPASTIPAARPAKRMRLWRAIRHVNAATRGASRQGHR